MSRPPAVCIVAIAILGCSQSTKEAASDKPAAPGTPAVTKAPPMTPEESAAVQEHIRITRIEEQRLTKELEACTDDELRNKAMARLNALRKKFLDLETSGQGRTAAPEYRKQIEGKSLAEIVNNGQADPASSRASSTSAPPTTQGKFFIGPVAEGFLAAESAYKAEQEIMERMSNENEKFERENVYPAPEKKKAAKTPKEQADAEAEFAKADAIRNEQAAKLAAQIQKVQKVQAKFYEWQERIRQEIKP